MMKPWQAFRLPVKRQRYSHPLTDRLGQRFVGGDERAALEGETYISKAVGTLGLSIRAFVPILDENARQTGVVSVGLLLQDLGRALGVGVAGVGNVAEPGDHRRILGKGL